LNEIENAGNMPELELSGKEAVESRARDSALCGQRR